MNASHPSVAPTRPVGPRALEGLVPLACGECGAGLAPRAPAGDAAFLCSACGRGWEPRGPRLVEVGVWTAAPTSELPPPPEVRHLAVWWFPARGRVRSKRSGSAMPPEGVWRELGRRAGDRPVGLFVPAFTLERVPVQQLGVRLTARQPEIRLTERAPVGALAGATNLGGGREPGWGEAPFRGVSPVVLGEADARVVAHFVYLATEADATPDLRSIDYDLDLGPARLVLVPAEYDVRFVRDSNWRLLLREFDSM